MADGRVVIDVMLEDGSVAKGVADLDKQLGGLGKSGEQASLGLGKIVTALGLVALGAKAIGMVKNSISSAFGRIDTMESFERVMTVITGSTEETNRALQRTGDIVTGTGYGLDVAAKAVQNFVTRGIDVDKATDRIEAWGDAVAFYGDGSNEQFANVTDALAKMSTTGRVHMDQLNRLFDVGIDAVGMYAKATGRDAESVQKDLSAGRITAEEFIDTVTEAMMEGTNGVVKIAGAAKEAGASWGASFDNMQAAVTRGVVNIIQKIDEMLTSNGLPTMRDMIAENGRLFERVLNSIADNIPAVVERIKSIYNALEPWLPLIKAVAAGVGAAILAFAGLNSAKNIVENLTQSFAVLNKVLKMNPWVLVVAAAVAAVVLIYQNWEPISGFFINLWNSIKEITLTVWESIKGVWQATAQWFTDLWAATVEFFTSIWSGIVDFFSSLWQSIVKIATSVWDVVVERWNEVVTHVKTIFSPLIDFYVTMWETISNNAKQYWNNIKSMFDTVWNNIRIAAKAAWELIKNVILGPILLLINLATGDMESFRENLRAIWGNIKNAASTIWNALKDSVVTVVKTLISNVRLAWDTFKVYISGLWTALLRTATNIFENIRASVREKTNQAKSTLQSIWNSVKSFFTETLTRMWNTVQQKFQDIVNAVKQKMNEAKRNVIEGWNAAMEFLRGIDLVQIGKDIIQGLINGIKGKIEDVRQAITDVTDAITGRIKSILQIASPSKLMKQFGNWVGEGLAIGMNDTVTTVKKSSDKLAAAAVPDLRQEIKATESQLRELNRVITDENNKTSRDRLNAVQNFIDNKKRLELISTQDEIAYWQEAVRQFKSGTEERRVAALALRDAKRNIDQQMFNSEKAWIEEKKKLNEL
ncbi:phage tail protein, partial [Halalkalibacterium ligniniphilum]|uniref:phage tail protein n=1 Tax=Halalkalibacterium ligniniphilum TaxID=1134413 RepID=UPI000364646F